MDPQQPVPTISSYVETPPPPYDHVDHAVDMDMDEPGKDAKDSLDMGTACHLFCCKLITHFRLIGFAVIVTGIVLAAIF